MTNVALAFGLEKKQRPSWIHRWAHRGSMHGTAVAHGYIDEFIDGSIVDPMQGTLRGSIDVPGPEAENMSMAVGINSAATMCASSDIYTFFLTYFRF